jgi:hypothetical protein
MPFRHGIDPDTDTGTDSRPEPERDPDDDASRMMSAMRAVTAATRERTIHMTPADLDSPEGRAKLRCLHAPRRRDRAPDLLIATTAVSIDRPPVA